MLSANYIFNFKRLGKLAYLWGTASAGATASQALLAITYEEVSDGLVDSIPGEVTLSPYLIQWNSQTSSSALSTIAINAASAYLIMPSFVGQLTTQPANKNSAASVLAALVTEMTTVDSVTLTTLSSTGLAAFFNAVAGSTLTWNTAADASATYKDSIYVVSTLV